MSVLTTSPLKSAPSAGAGVAITTGASYVFGPWVQVIAVTVAPIAVAGIEFDGGTYSALMWELDIGTGAPGAEVSVGTVRVYLHNSGTIGCPSGLLLPVPLGGIGAGVRVAVRARGPLTSGPATLSLQYYENFSGTQVTTASQVLTSAPAGAATAALAPSATPWANSPWVALIAGTATDIGMIGLTHYTNSGFGADDGIEYDIGTGNPGAEVVATTLRQATATQRFTMTWLPGIYPIVAGTRVAVRMRKSGTNTTAHDVALLYYTGVSPLPPVTITPPTLPGTSVGAAYTAQLVGHGGDGGPYTFSVVSGSLPAGVALSSAGTFSGTVTGSGGGTFVPDALPPATVDVPYMQVFSVTPAAGSTATFTVRATDGSGHTADQAYTLTVAGWAGGATYTLAGGTWPKCLTLQPDGTLTGAVMTVGTWTVTVRATDAAGQMIERIYTLTAHS